MAVAKACVGMLLITLKFLLMMTQATNTVAPEGHHYQIFNVVNSIPTQALAALF